MFSLNKTAICLFFKFFKQDIKDITSVIIHSGLFLTKHTPACADSCTHTKGTSRPTHTSTHYTSLQAVNPETNTHSTQVRSHLHTHSQNKATDTHCQSHSITTDYNILYDQILLKLQLHHKTIVTSSQRAADVLGM